MAISDFYRWEKANIRVSDQGRLLTVVLRLFPYMLRFPRQVVTINTSQISSLKSKTHLLFLGLSKEQCGINTSQVDRGRALHQVFTFILLINLLIRSCMGSLGLPEQSTPDGVWLQQQRFTASWFWRPDIQDQRVGRNGSSCGLWGRLCPWPFSLSCRWRSSCAQGVLLVLHVVSSLRVFLCS